MANRHEPSADRRAAAVVVPVGEIPVPSGNIASRSQSTMIRAVSPPDQSGPGLVGQTRLRRDRRGRGAPGKPPVFHIFEFWIEDRFMLEVATPDMVAAYAETIQPARLDALFGQRAAA